MQLSMEELRVCHCRCQHGRRWCRSAIPREARECEVISYGLVALEPKSEFTRIKWLLEICEIFLGSSKKSLKWHRTQISSETIFEMLKKKIIRWKNRSSWEYNQSEYQIPTPQQFSTPWSHVHFQLQHDIRPAHMLDNVTLYNLWHVCRRIVRRCTDHRDTHTQWHAESSQRQPAESCAHKPSLLKY